MILKCLRTKGEINARKAMAASHILILCWLPIGAFACHGLQAKSNASSLCVAMDKKNDATDSAPQYLPLGCETWRPKESKRSLEESDKDGHKHAGKTGGPVQPPSKSSSNRLTETCPSKDC